MAFLNMFNTSIRCARKRACECWYGIIYIFMLMICLTNHVTNKMSSSITLKKFLNLKQYKVFNENFCIYSTDCSEYFTKIKKNLKAWIFKLTELFVKIQGLIEMYERVVLIKVLVHCLLYECVDTIVVVKLLTMLPTEEERSRIQEAQAASPDLPLGSAEQFLLTLASISELPARLKLWAFKLDFENSEKEIADPLMDLKQGMETLRMNKTFRGILSTLLSIGIFLNGNEVKGFQLEYLTKVPEVKDTVHKHSLLHHLCHMVMEKFPDSTDLYSEIGAVTRASKIDFDELASNISKLESECKASWDHLKLIAKHDGSTMMKVKMSDFLADCAERIIVLSIVHRRIINRFHKFILWLGIPLHRVQDTKPNEFCRIVSEFALEYRTTRERVIQQLEKKANHRERNKTRGKMITEANRADAELRQLLGSDISDVESIHGRTLLGPILRDETTNGNVTDGDDELLESLVKTATKCPSTRTTPRERKRTRNADLRRTLKNGLSEEEKKHIAAYIKGY
ncbi:Similar to FHOD3: FH1/FH2 domain-containing protein 3 (Homo sapiens) [Cotesia congregata]|uniref:Similar to FHOD3: FH1/FH2 domain-containing protein 3 (Homo sapiens) n=1 Tax=Cotesia congregata TaxID=51543 RepID=A0A8J2HKJ6_COTCN|nr:Similar to FHOD3: FH1/FH2 domain-containing protein 3 (Homo sapiens) [Cotesia congregata]